MASGIGFNLLLLGLVLVMTPRFYSGCFALVVPSNFPSRMQNPMGAAALSMTSSVEGTFDEATLLEPKAVSSKVFSSDQRPVILFDGGKASNIVELRPFNTPGFSLNRNFSYETKF